MEPYAKINKSVSIIVPVFNAEKYLSRCLVSLINQTLRDIEILCVNDGSTDNSLEILNEYAKNDLRIIVFNQNNKGPGIARNTALDKAQGKYIIFCDADDTLEPETCLECCTAMENNQVDMVIFNSNIIEVDRIERGKKNPSGQYISIVKPETEGFLNQKGCYKSALSGTIWGYFFRSDVIYRYNLRFTHYRQGEDTTFLHSYLMVIQSGYAMNKTLYNYYVHKGSLADAVMDKHPFLSRFMLLFRILWNTLIFAVKNKMLLKARYVFYWCFIWLQSRM